MLTVFAVSAISSGAEAQNNTITACFRNTNGNVRLVQSASECKNNETAATWNIVGPQGATGPQGPPGEPAGPAVLFTFTSPLDPDLSPSSLLTINPTTGVTNVVGPILGFGRRDGLALAFAPDGTLFGSISEGPDATPDGVDTIVTLDPTTGAVTIVGNTRGNTGIAFILTSLAFAPDGTLFALEDTNPGLLTIDTTTGAATIVGGDVNTRALAIDQSGTLFTASNSLFTLDRTTGDATEVGPLSDQFGGFTYVVSSLAFAPDGTLFGVGLRRGADDSLSSRLLLTIDPATGAVTDSRTLAPFGRDFVHGLTFRPDPVPSP